MTLDAQVQNGMIVPLQSLPFAEGTKLRIEAEVVPSPAEDKKPRVGGEWRGKVWIAPDFDELPPDIAEAFGMK
jgi:hypothetical protein